MGAQSAEHNFLDDNLHMKESYCNFKLCLSMNFAQMKRVEHSVSWMVRSWYWACRKQTVEFGVSRA
jgi:hypothetical protein